MASRVQFCFLGHKATQESQWEPEPCQPQPCLLCKDVSFSDRASFVDHVEKQHGGLQRYRNAYLCLSSMLPHVVKGQEIRSYVQSFSEFHARAAMDWEGLGEDPALDKPTGAAARERWQPRHRAACVFCARTFWFEELLSRYLAGSKCFMQKPQAVWQMLSTAAYSERWPLIPWTELEASSVHVPCSGAWHTVLLHKRRVTEAMVRGDEPACVCRDCAMAFSGSQPKLCKYALANDLWLGRFDPLMRGLNVAHQVLHARARVVAHKIVLRRDESTASGRTQVQSNGAGWDYLFHQSGYVGSAILFSNGECRTALEQVPARKISDSFAITLCKSIEDADQEQAKRELRKVSKLMVNRKDFLREAAAFKGTNQVYSTTTCDEELLAQWCPDAEVPCVPPPILDSVVAVPVEGSSPGQVAAQGPGDSTEGQFEAMAEEDVAAARDRRYVSAFEPVVEDLNNQDSHSAEVIALLTQLQEMEKTAARSVALEVEAAVVNGTESGGLLDSAGRARLLQMCDDVRAQCQKLSKQDFEAKLERELRLALEGRPPWQLEGAMSAGDPGPHEGQANSMRNLLVPRAKQPLSLFDWKIWSMARPELWRYGDCGNMYDRQAELTTRDWMACLLLREELEYTLPEEEELYTAPPGNRFAKDWVALHLMATVDRLVDQKQSIYTWLTDGGIKAAKKLQSLTSSTFAEAARALGPQASLKSIMQSEQTPQQVKDALSLMQMSTSSSKEMVMPIALWIFACLHIYIERERARYIESDIERDR